MFLNYYKKIKYYLLRTPYSAENFVTAGVLICFLKIVLFSLGIRAPEVAWDWRLLTIFVFIVANLSILIVLFSPIFLMKSRKIQIAYGLTINFALSFVIVANRIYNLFFHSYISLQTVAHSTEGISWIQAIYSTMKMGEFFWIIDIPLLLYIFTRQPQSQTNFAISKNMSTFTKVSLIASFIILLWTPAMSMYIESAKPHPNIQLRESGPFMYYTREAVGQTQIVEEAQKDVRDNPRIKEWFANNKPEHPGENLFGEMKDKNLILLQIEALQNIVIHKEINGQEITPNLNRLIEKSLSFSKTYDQTDMATADAEALVNFSLYPPGDVSAYMRYPDNHYNSLPRSLKEEGYSTAVLHGFFEDFYNRGKAYPNVGFEEFYSKDSYIKDELYDGLLGDKTFLEQSLDHIENLNEPYMAYVITLVSHHPFNYIEEEDYDEIDVSGYEGTIVGDYIRSIHYTDAAIGKFYEGLKERGMLENTLLVFYGDHAAFNYNERDYRKLNKFFGVNVHRPEEQITIHKVPFAIYDHKSKITGVIDEKMGMIDIFPTVANVLGVHNQYTMGRDVLNSDEEFVIFRDNSFIKEGVYFYSKENIFFELESGKEIEVEEKEEWLAETKEALEISDMIYLNDFFGTEFFKELQDDE